MAGARSGGIVMCAAIAAGCFAGCFSPTATPGLPCTDAGKCPSGLFCDSTGTCVELSGGADGPHADASPNAPDATPIGCDGPADCPFDQPVCDLDSHTCRGCVADAECASDACLEYTGQCIAEAETLYVALGGISGACTRAAPCGAVYQAVNQSGPARKMIKVGDGAYPGGSFQFDQPAVQIYVSGEDRSWDGAVLSPNSMGIRVRTNANVVIEGITIQDAVSDGINQQGGTLRLERVKLHRTGQAGLDVRDGTLVMHESWLEDAGANGVFANNMTVDIARSMFLTNTNGGISATACAITVVNSLVVQNGTGGGDTSGIELTTSQLGSRIAFTTVADNDVDLGPGGIDCNDTPVAVDSSIFAGGGTDQIDNTCVVSYSLADSGLQAGTGNLVGDPMFVNPFGRDYHIQSGSPARDVADPAATEGRDYDGEPRPQGTGRDVGADEVP